MPSGAKPAPSGAMPSGAKPEAEAAPEAVAAEGPASGGPVAAEGPASGGPVTGEVPSLELFKFAPNTLENGLLAYALEYLQSDVILAMEDDRSHEQKYSSQYYSKDSRFSRQPHEEDLRIRSR